MNMAYQGLYMPSVSAQTNNNPHNSTGTYTSDSTLPSPKLEKKQRGFSKTCKKLLASARSSVRRHACVGHEVDHNPTPSRPATRPPHIDFVNPRTPSLRGSPAESVRISGGLDGQPDVPLSAGLRAGPRARTAQPVRDSTIHYSVHIVPESPIELERLHPSAAANGRPGGRQGTRTAPRFAHPLVNAVIMPSTLTPMSSCSDLSLLRPSLDSRSPSYGTDVDTDAHSMDTGHTSWTSTDHRIADLPAALQIQRQRGSRRLSPADLWNPTETRRREREASSRAFANRMDGLAPAFPAAAADVNKLLPPLPVETPAPAAQASTTSGAPTLPHIPYAPSFASCHDFAPGAPPVNQRDFDIFCRGMMGPHVPASLLPGVPHPARPHTVAITPSSAAFGAERDASGRPPPMGYLPFPGGAFDPFNSRGAGGASPTTAGASPSNFTRAGSTNDSSSSSVTSTDASTADGSTLPAVLGAMEEFDRTFHTQHMARVARVESAVLSPLGFDFGSAVAGAQDPSQSRDTHPNPLRSHAPAAPHPYPTRVADQIRRRPVPGATRAPVTNTRTRNVTGTLPGVPSNTSSTPNTFGRNLGLAPNVNKPLPFLPGVRSPRRFTRGIVPPPTPARARQDDSCSRPACRVSGPHVHGPRGVHMYHGPRSVRAVREEQQQQSQRRNFSVRFPRLDARQAARNSAAEPRYTSRYVDSVEARHRREERETRERRERRRTRIGRIGRGFAKAWAV